MSDQEQAIRKLLWLQHTQADCNLYGDDGQMQCSACGIDFKTDPPDQIERMLVRRAAERIRKAMADRVVEAPVKPVSADFKYTGDIAMPDGTVRFGTVTMKAGTP